MKNKVINAASCDVRDVTEESLAGFDSITINTATLITGKRANELLSRFPVTVNAASVIEVPEDCSILPINGKYEIGPGTDGKNTVLSVNGTLTALDGSLEALKSFENIIVNGKVLMPESFRGQFRNLKINGKTVYYPDGAVLLKGDTVINDLFVARAKNTLYDVPGKLFILDSGLDTEKFLEKGLRFSAEKIIIAKSFVEALAPRFNEETEMIIVPDGTAIIDDDLSITAKTLRKYGSKLFVSGDVEIEEKEVLSSLEYLYAEGTVRIPKELEEAFEKIESVYEELKTFDPERGLIADRPSVKVGALLLKRYPNGLSIEDCAKVTLSEDLTAEEILEKIRISDCAKVVCTKAQEEAVLMITEDVAMIKTSDADRDDQDDDSLNGFFGFLDGNFKDTQVINCPDYKM